MLLLIRPKKQLTFKRREPIIPATKRIGAFASQIFLGLVGLGMSLRVFFKEKPVLHYKALMDMADHVAVVAESFILLVAVLGLLFVRNREEH
jgi:hypothetical protein